MYDGLVNPVGIVDRVGGSFRNGIHYHLAVPSSRHRDNAGVDDSQSLDPIHK